jgi:lipoprotein-anchoring transpeptidase ErfK/SrfK
MTGITVTTLLTSVATASAQNIFEAMFGRPWSPPVTVPDANFTARDRQQLANPPYQQAWIPPAYRRQIVQYHRKEAPGSILVDTDKRYVYYVLPKGKAIRYGAIVGEDAQAWSGVATVGRKAEWPGWTPTESEKRRLGPLPNYVEGGARNPMGARALYLYSGGQDTLYRVHGTNQPGWIGHAISSGCIRLTNEDVIDLYSEWRWGRSWWCWDRSREPLVSHRPAPYRTIRRCIRLRRFGLQRSPIGAPERLHAMRHGRLRAGPQDPNHRHRRLLRARRAATLPRRRAG